MTFETFFLINAFCSFYMTGLIWLIQIVLYPAFNRFDEPVFLSFHRFHVEQISYVVVPVMLLEIITSTILFISFGELWWINFTGWLCVIIIWISTFFVQVPLHRKVREQATPLWKNRLIRSNWVRTSLWTLKSAFSFWGLYMLLL